MSADISQKSLADSVHPEDQDIYRDAIAECLEKTDRTVSVDLRHPRFDGSLFWTRWEFCAAFDSDGKPEGIQCIGNDISERKRAELEKLQAQENLQLLMNNTEESFMMIGKDLQVLSYNAAADKKINTFAHLSMKKGLSVLALDPPEKHDAIRKIFRDVFKGKEHETEARFPGNNGSAVIYSNHYKPAYSDSKEIVAAVVTSRDITEKKIAEEKLISNERHFRALIENSAEGLAVVTAEGNLIEVSPSGEKLLGFSAKEIRDGEKKYIVHPDDLDAVSKIFSEVVAEPFSLKKSEHRVLTAFGEYIWLAATYHNLLNEPSIQGIVINFREQGIRTKKHITLDEIGRRLALGNFKQLNLIIKGDVDGSVEALSDSLQKLSTEEIAVSVVHKAVGAITESDVLLATASDAIVIGFNVRPSLQASRLSETEGVEIKTYSIIYNVIDEIKSAMEGMLEPKIQEKIVANVEVRNVFKFDKATVAGCYVLDGKIQRNSKIRVIRDGIVEYPKGEGQHAELGSLKRFKDDAKEVPSGMECGLTVKNFNDMRVGDIIEAFEEEEVKRTL